MIHMDITDAPAGQGQQSPATAIMSLVHADTTLHSIQLALGLACSILGGYVAARIAKNGEVLNGALSSFLCILLGIYSAASGKVLESPAEHMLLSQQQRSAAFRLGNRGGSARHRPNLAFHVFPLRILTPVKTEFSARACGAAISGPMRYRSGSSGGITSGP